MRQRYRALYGQLPEAHEALSHDDHEALRLGVKCHREDQGKTCTLQPGQRESGSGAQGGSSQNGKPRCRTPADPASGGGTGRKTRHLWWRSDRGSDSEWEPTGSTGCCETGKASAEKAENRAASLSAGESFPSASRQGSPGEKSSATVAEPRKQSADGQHKIKGSLSQPANRDANHGSSENRKSKSAVHPAGSKTANDPAAYCATNRDRTATRGSCSRPSRASTSDAEEYAFDSGAEGKGTSRLAEHNTSECRASTGSCARSKKSCGPASNQDTAGGASGTANDEGSRQSKRTSAACHFSSRP